MLVRTLEEVDLPRLTTFFPDQAPVFRQLRLELRRSDVYVWKGLVDEDGTVVGIHKALIFGNHLLLKGVAIAGKYRGSTASLRLALALKSHAIEHGLAGAAAWIELTKPERHLAIRLRLAERGPAIHRYQLPLVRTECPNPKGDSNDCGGVPLRGTIVAPCNSPLVKNVFSPEVDEIHWVVDNHRIVLSGTPFATIDEVRSFAISLSTLAAEVGASAVEFPLAAADLLSALAMVSLGGCRLTRTPVRLGLHSIDATEAPAARNAARPQERHDTEPLLEGKTGTVA